MVIALLVLIKIMTYYASVKRLPSAYYLQLLEQQYSYMVAVDCSRGSCANGSHRPWWQELDFVLRAANQFTRLSGCRAAHQLTSLGTTRS